MNGVYKVRETTKAGRYHLHLILRTDLLLFPVHWPTQTAILSLWWSQLHDSPIVDDREIRARIKKNGRRATARDMAGYVAKYASKEAAKRAYSYDWSWVWRGFVRDWKEICREVLKAGRPLAEAVRLWETLLTARRHSVGGT